MRIIHDELEALLERESRGPLGMYDPVAVRSTGVAFTQCDE
jgi:hypothetical protein